MPCHVRDVSKFVGLEEIKPVNKFILYKATCDLLHTYSVYGNIY